MKFWRIFLCFLSLALSLTPAAAKDFKKSDEPSTSNIDPSKILMPEGSLSEAAQAFQDFENSDLAKELQRSMQASLAAGTSFSSQSVWEFKSTL